MKKTSLRCEVHITRPSDFSPSVEVAGCFLEINGRILLLQASDEKLESRKWGVPGGKLEKNETPEQAVIRELFEETGISLNKASQIQQLPTLYIRKTETDFVFHLFKIDLDAMPGVVLSNEHLSYTWATDQELLSMPLMLGADEVLKHCRAMTSKKTRAGASVNSYLILYKDGKLLLQLRKNTGYCDGMWGLVAGHVEDGESATEAMIREAHEELGILVSPQHLQAAHVMHRKTNRFNIDVFFVCSGWQGDIANLEEEKCEKLDFFALDALPDTLIDYHRIALDCLAKDELYSELGWN